MKELVLPTNKAINLKASILLSAKTFSVHLSRNIVQGLPLSLVLVEFFLREECERGTNERQDKGAILDCD